MVDIQLSEADTETGDRGREVYRGFYEPIAHWVQAAVLKCLGANEA